MLRDANGEERKGIEVYSRERDMRDAVNTFLKEMGYRTAFEVYRQCGLADIYGVKFADRVGRRVPPATSIIAVELKLDDVAGVLAQCSYNWHSANLSCAAMPSYRIQRMRTGTIDLFSSQGFGLISVSPDSVEFVIDPREHETSNENWHATNMPKKLWRMFRKEICQQSAT